MKRLLIHGCGGKMGRVVAGMAAEYGLVPVAGVDSMGAQCDFPVFADIASCTEQVDVIIDFTRPDALAQLLGYVSRTHTPLVIATTGFSDDEQALIRAHAKQSAIFMAANMSLGVNLMLDLARRSAAFLGDGCDVEIIEKHHNQKVDSPSGTAIALANAVNEAHLNGKRFTYGRQGNQTKRSKAEIGIHAVRGGNIVGEHEVMFIAPKEVISLTHSAQDRAVFASGALTAAAFLCDKKAGFYDMNHLLLASSAVTNIFADDGQVLYCLSGINPADGTVSDIFAGLTRANVNVDMINQTDDGAGKLAMGISLPKSDSINAMEVLVEVFARHGGRFLRRDDVIKIVVEGEGMAAQSGIAARFYQALLSVGAPPLIVTTSDNNISCCVQNTHRRDALESLMSEFNL